VSPWKVIAATLVIFCSGLVVGGLMEKKALRAEFALPAARISTNGVPSLWHVQQREFLRRIDRELNLTQEQHDKIQQILKQSQERTKVIREKIAPEMKDEIKRVRDEIRAELAPEQQAKFEAAMKSKPARRPEDGAQEPKRKLPKDGVRRQRTNSNPSKVPAVNP
jgi:hypothetical protein